MRIQECAIKTDDIFLGRIFGISGTAGVIHGRLREEIEILFSDDTLQIFGNADILRKLRNGIAGGSASLFERHGVDPFNAHCLGDIPVLFARGFGIIPHDRRQKNGVCDAVRGIVHRAQGMRHRMNDAEADVRKAHPGYILAEGHAFSAFLFALDSRTQGAGNDLDRLQMEHIRHLPRALGDVALNGVRERIHARRGGQAFGHRTHHIAVNDGDDGDIVDIHADELALLFDVGDDIVDGNFRRGACRRGYRDDRNARLFGGSDALQTAHILKLGIRDDDADRLGGIHRGTAADRDDIIGPARLERSHARLHVFDGRIGLDIRIQLVGEACFLQYIEHFIRHFKFHEVGIGADECLCQAAPLHFPGNLADRTRAVIADLVQYDSVCHNTISFLRYFYKFTRKPIIRGQACRCAF